MFRENPRGVTFISSTSQGEAQPTSESAGCVKGHASAETPGKPKIWAASGLGKVHENPTIPMERSQVDSPPIVQFLGSTFRNLDSGGWWVFTNFCTPPCCSHQLYTIVTSSIPLNHPGSSVVRSRGISPNRIRWEVLQMTVSFGRIFWQISSSKSFVFLAN